MTRTGLEVYFNLLSYVNTIYVDLRVETGIPQLWRSGIWVAISEASVENL